MSYKRLGDFVNFISVKNTDNEAEILYGINIDKFFMPSVANIIGVDLTKYKVVKKFQFACNRMHIGRDMRIPISMSDYDYPFIVSPAYDVFEVIDENILPEYLMIWFKRKEFDRECWFYTDADVRGGLSLEALKMIKIPIPSIEKQREIVAQYQSIEAKIKTNEALCQKLEATAQTLYKHWFVDFEFPNENGKPYFSSGGEMVYHEELQKEIPKGWEVKKVKNFCKDMKNGATPKREILEYWNSNDIPWLKTGEISNNVIFDTEEYISKKGFENSSTKLIPADSVLMAMYGATAGQLGYLKQEVTTNQACCAMVCDNKEESALLYYALLHQQSFITTLANGGAQANLSKQIIEELDLVLPQKMIDFDYSAFSKIIDYKAIKTRESQNLKKLQSLLLAKMGESV